MNHMKLFLTCPNDQTKEVMINMINMINVFKTYIFIIRGKIKAKNCKSNKLKIIAPLWNDEFELPDGSYYVSDIQDYINYIFKNHGTLTAIPPIDVSIKRINDRLVFKIKNRYKLELKTPETMKLFGSLKKLIDKIKNEENVPSQTYQRIEVVEVVLVQCSFVDNEYQQASEVLYTFTPNKSYAYLLNVEPSNLVF